MTTWSDAAKVALERRILARDAESGELTETPNEMFERVAYNVSAAESIYGASELDRGVVAADYLDILTSTKFLPNSPCLVNAGRPLQQLAACFVLPVEDSIPEIFEAVKTAAIIHQTGGGTGFGFGRLRPAGSQVRSTGKVASGPVSFMKVFDAATASIKQGGVRRGANMGVLPIDHPDVREFIAVKGDNQTLSNFNISLAITDEFMRCLETDTPFELRWGGRVYDTVRPGQLWDEITQAAWTSGDPGLLFIDEINRGNPTPALGRIEATNPCGEVPLLPNHTCNLGSIDVAKFWRNDQFDWADLERTVILAVRFLDSVIDMSKYPTPLIDEATKLDRKIGLGIMGWADLLIKMRVPYGSEEAHAFAGKLMSFIQEVADDASHELAEQRGVFPALWLDDTFEDDRFMRNASRTVIAPTGTISILANCSSGIEPLFGLTFRKNVMDTQITHVSEAAKEVLVDAGVWSEDVEARLLGGTPASQIPGLSPRVADILRTAHEIPVYEHLETQAIFQKHVDDSISKTINFSNDATPGLIGAAYYDAYKLDCKGVTVYRDGCKSGGQVLQFHSNTNGTHPLVGDVVSIVSAPVLSSVEVLGSRCPECSGAMIHSEGCEECQECGLSMCAA